MDKNKRGEKKFRVGGTVLYYDSNMNRHIADIDVDDGCDTVVFTLQESSYVDVNIELNDSKKVFPDVKKIVIGSDITYIEIPNEMFPNAVKIESNNKYYISADNILVVRQYDSTSLLNVFGTNENDVIDLKHCSKIENNAFRGCKTKNIINTHYIDSIEENAFTGSAIIEDADKTKPLIKLNNMIIGVNDGFKEAVIRDEDFDGCIIENCPFDKLEKLTICNYKLYLNKWNIRFPDTVEIKCNAMLFSSFKFLQILMNDIKKLIINNEHYITIDDSVYSKDMKQLYYVSKLKTDTFKVLDGVKAIESKAFCKSNISEIILPDSLILIKKEAFYHCKSISNIVFGKNLRFIGGMSFYHCKFNELTIPGTINEIRDSAFWWCDIDKINLKEGVCELGEDCFCRSKFKTDSIELPSSLYKLGESSLSEFKNIKFNSVFMSGLINSINRAKGELVTFNINGQNYYIPSLMDIDEKNIKSIENDILINERKPQYYYDLYKNITDTNLKHKMAIEIYFKTHDEEIKKYIRKIGTTFVKNALTGTVDEEYFIKVLKLNLLTPQALKKALEIAQMRNLVMISSYIMDLLNDEQKNSSFSL